MPYERDPRVVRWFELALSDARPRVRRRAVELLEHVETDERAQWLERAQHDADPQVAATASLVAALISMEQDQRTIELLESDILQGLEDSDLEWEWEYSVKVCEGTYVPPSVRLVWSREENDDDAKQMALMKATAFNGRSEKAVPIIVGKRLVTRYTRSSRSQSEAMLWHQHGRPRYEGH